MRTLLFLVAALGLMACGTGPETFPAMVNFTVTTPDGRLTKQATTYLVVERPGATRLIDGWAEDAGDGEVYGRHRFPAGTTGAAIALYYWGLLRNAGWKDDADFVADPAASRLAFGGVTAIDAGTDSEELLVAVETRGR